MVKISSALNTKVEVSESGISFRDCTYNCKNGKLVNAYTRTSQICPYCSEKRRDMVKGVLTDEDNKTIYDKLCIPKMFRGTEYNFNYVLPEFARKWIDSDSVDAVEEELDNLITRVSIGDIPETSLLFNMGSRVNETEFIYPFMIRSYMAGLRVAPLISSFQLTSLRNEFEEYGEDSQQSSEGGSSFKDYLESDICVISLDSGTTALGLRSIKGLMQLRALRNKITIIFTNLVSNDVQYLCYDGEEYRGKNLARLITVVYTKDQRAKEESMAQAYSTPPRTPGESTSSSRGGMTTSDFNSLISGGGNLL